ncbi:MAG: 6-phosphogluconolactonase [Pseudomonadota bacterium]
MTAAGNRSLPGTRETRWHVMPDGRALVAAVSDRILESAKTAINRHGRFRIVLAGGTTPEAVYMRLANAATDWSRWQVYFGDERCLPAWHPERNSAMATVRWLGRVALPAANIHTIHAELGAEAAALAYAPVIEQARPFDLVLLGMGEDGHTASLFPGQPHAAGELVHAVHDAPKPPPDRVSLGEAALNDAAEVLVMVSGTGKHAAVQRWRSGEDLPVAHMVGQAGAEVYLDKEAETGETA